MNLCKGIFRIKNKYNYFAQIYIFQTSPSLPIQLIQWATLYISDQNSANNDISVYKLINQVL